MTKFGFTPSNNQMPKLTGPIKLHGIQIQRALQQGIALQHDRRFPEAEYQYQLVLYNDPQNTEALNLLGTVAIEAKSITVAIDYMGKAVKLAPKNPIYRNNLGNAYLQQQNFVFAKKHLRKAIELDRKFIEPLCNLGKAYKLMLKGPEAEKFYQRALKIKPTSEMALVGIAELIIDNGRPLDAAVYFRKALQNNPNCVEALCGLAVTQKFKPGAPEANMIKTQIKRPNSSPHNLILLHHAAGKILNDQGEYQQAIAHFSTAKTFSQNKFDMKSHQQLYDSFIACFNAEFFATRQNFGNPTTRPVFIIGMPRSGTTLTEQICASHPDVYGAGELGHIRKIANKLGFGDADPQIFIDQMRNMTKEKSQTLAQEYLQKLKNINTGTLRIVDKMPHNYEFMALITLLFPNAKIINCNRDPMDNCLSCFMHNFSEFHGYNADLTTIGLYYRQYHHLMSHWNDALPVPILTMQYENIVSDLKKQARALIDFLDLDWNDACLSFHETDRTVRTPSRWQVRQPIYTSAVNRWKHYGDSLIPLQNALGELVDE
jgi:tetratricopeptide (TPR) repeat protein